MPHDEGGRVIRFTFGWSCASPDLETQTVRINTPLRTPFPCAKAFPFECATILRPVDRGLPRPHRSRR